MREMRILRIWSPPKKAGGGLSEVVAVHGLKLKFDCVLKPSLAVRSFFWGCGNLPDCMTSEVSEESETSRLFGATKNIIDR